MLSKKTDLKKEDIMKLKILILVLISLCFALTTALAVPTEITVRIKTKDAKFLGTSMGGALVTITDAGTGEQLARGVTEGSTGNTDIIMKLPLERGKHISDETSAKYTAMIDINEPVQLKITAQGPLSEPHAMNSVQVTQWVIPGKHINRGDAMLLELPGLMVKLLSPAQGQILDNTKKVEIQAVVRMM
jgi:hypothetical protein